MGIRVERSQIEVYFLLVYALRRTRMNNSVKGLEGLRALAVTCENAALKRRVTLALKELEAAQLPYEGVVNECGGVLRNPLRPG